MENKTVTLHKTRPSPLLPSSHYIIVQLCYTQPQPCAAAARQQLPGSQF